MDLIYTDERRQDVGVLKDYTFDLAFGSDENDFELTLDAKNHCCTPDCLLYIENTEYGGIVDGLGVVTNDNNLSYKGRTWHGVLASKIIAPRTVSGEANEVLGALLEDLGLTNLFVASNEESGLMIESYSFKQYVDAYSGIKKMLESVNGKMKFLFSGGMVAVSALRAVDYSKDEQFDSEQVEMSIEKTFNTVNHLICVEKQDAEDKKGLPTVHLYKDTDGTFKQSETPLVSGIQEISRIYEYSSEDDLKKLIAGESDKLKEYLSTDKIQMDFSADENTYDVGDIVGAKESITGIVASEKITKKIVTIREGEVNIQYKVGE